MNHPNPITREAQPITTIQLVGLHRDHPEPIGTVGLLIRGPDGVWVHARRLTATRSANEAVFAGANAALEAAIDRGCRGEVVIETSLAMLAGAWRGWKIKAPHLLAHLARMRKLAETFARVEVGRVGKSELAAARRAALSAFAGGAS